MNVVAKLLTTRSFGRASPADATHASLPLDMLSVLLVVLLLFMRHTFPLKSTSVCDSLRLG